MRKKLEGKRGYLALEDLRIKSKFTRSNMSIREVGWSGERKPEREEKEEEEGSGRNVGDRVKTPHRRHRYWRQARCRILALSLVPWLLASSSTPWRWACVLTRHPTFLPEPSSSSFSSLSGFFSLHFTLPHESAYWTLKTLIWSIDLREQGILVFLLVFFVSIRYILVGFLNVIIVIT